MARNTSITVRLIGVNNSDLTRQSMKAFNLRSTEYANEFEMDIPLNQQTQLKNITFSQVSTDTEVQQGK